MRQKGGRASVPRGFARIRRYLEKYSNQNEQPGEQADMTDENIRMIGRYEIEREIGRGGMAIVYKAFDPRLERTVAIKLIRNTAFSAEAFGHIRERFEREAKALARLDHPNIVKVHDFGEHAGAPYLVMDYLEGATLKEVRKPLRVETAARLIRPVAEALDYVHRNGLLHRDVKPSNIMITKAERVILTDFGIAKWMEDEGDLYTLTGTGIGIGTPEYMAPEQGRGKRIDERSDMYSLTIVFYELITGKKPYGGDTPLDVLMNQVSEPIPDPRAVVPEISESVKRFLDRAMAKKPEDRYPAMTDYVRDLDGLRLQSLAQSSSTTRSSQPAKSPQETGGTTGIQMTAQSERTTDSSIRFGKTDFRKVEAAAEAVEAAAEPALASRVWRKLWPAALLVGLLVIPGIFALYGWRQEMAAIQQKETAVSTVASGLMSSVETELLSTIVSQTQTEIAQTEIAMNQNPYVDVKAGDIIEFGRYEQDNDLSNGAEPIEWLVLDVSDGSALVTSRYGLDAKRYHDGRGEEATWDTCTLRTWLNEYFYESAFDAPERKLILLTDVKNTDNPKHGTDGRNDTQGHVFLLSLDEAQRFFMGDEARQLVLTDYSIMQGVNSIDPDFPWWWLRSPSGRGRAARIYSHGSIHFYGNPVGSNVAAVRPALRIRLDSNFVGSENLFSTLTPEASAATVMADKALSAIEQISAAEIPLGTMTVTAATATAENLNPYADVKVGDIIEFGRYEQDNDFSNGAEPIEWIVLERRNNTLLMLSVLGLEVMAYHTANVETTWSRCPLRIWLNSDFFNSAFAPTEQFRFPEDQDRVFLLTVSDIEKFYKDPKLRSVAPSIYVSAKMKDWQDSQQYWWINAPVISKDDSAYYELESVETGINGEIRGRRYAILGLNWMTLVLDKNGTYVNMAVNTPNVVRPAIRININ